MADAFEPKFADLVRNFTTTVGTGNFKLGAAVAGFASFASALQPGDRFYYSAIGVDKPAESEVGRGTLQTDGTISREPVAGAATNFSSGTKTLALIAAAEWFSQVQAGGGASAGSGSGAAIAATKAALAAASPSQGPTLLCQAGCEGLFVFDESDLSAGVANDVRQGIYVSPSADAGGASGAWVRADRATINAEWFMTPAEIADVRAFTYAVNATAALSKAAAAVEANGGGTLVIPPGGYLVGEQTFQGTALDGILPVAYGPEEIITIKNCERPVKISGYGAVLKAAPGLHYGSFDPVTGERFDPVLPFLDYDYYAYPYRGMLNLANNASVTVEGVELDGNNTLLALGGYWGDSQWQLEGAGMWLEANGSVTVRDVFTHNQPLDGIILTAAGVTEADEAAPSLFENVRSRFNGRQGISWTGGKNVTFVNCDFSQTGQALNTVSDEVVQSHPGAGIDIEPSMARDGTFINCTFIGNWVQGVVAASGNSARMHFYGCKIENLTTARPAYTFTNCLVLGSFFAGIAVVDEYTGLTRTSKDAQVFRRCTFSYDPALTESGTLINAAQANLTGFNWGRMIDCSIETGTVNLPNLNGIGALSEKTPIFVNCRWLSTSATGVNFQARFQGYNYVDCGAAPNFNWGVWSRIETGDVIVNGVRQAVPVKLPDGDYGDVVVSGSGATMKVESANPASGKFDVIAPAATDSYVAIRGDAVKTRAVQFNTSSLFRWQAGADNAGEGGSNGGTNFFIARYSDAGGFLGFAMTINRATGATAFGGALNAGSLAVSGTLTSSGGGIGYATGAGGAVSQATSKSTGVTVNKPCGKITMNAAALAAGAAVEFTVANNSVAASDTINVNLVAGAASAIAYRYWISTVGPGAFNICVENRSGGSLSEALGFSFAVVKAVAA